MRVGQLLDETRPYEASPRRLLARRILQTVLAGGASYGFFTDSSGPNVGSPIGIGGMLLMLGWICRFFPENQQPAKRLLNLDYGPNPLAGWTFVRLRWFGGCLLAGGVAAWLHGLLA